MNEQHIIDILDSKPLGLLSADELSSIAAHSAECGKCGGAFDAARKAAALLKFEAGQVFEPSPFFHTKVLAALKDKRGVAKPMWDLWRIWQASGSLVSLMIAMVAALFFAGAMAPNTQAIAPADPAEAVIFQQENTLRDITNEQIFQEIYER